MISVQKRVFKQQIWSEEETELVKALMNPGKLANEPLMIQNNRSYSSIEKKINRIIANERKAKRIIASNNTPSYSKESGNCSKVCIKKEVCDLTCEQFKVKAKI